jgi:ribonuclease Z
MTASVRILSTSSVDSAPAILIISPDGSKILVNCGEGTQRTFLEHGQKVSSIRAVCLSHLHHTAIGGLPGVLLTFADIDANATSPLKGIDLIGPTGTQQFVKSLGHFMQRKDLHVRVQEGNVSNFTTPPLASSRAKDSQSLSFSIQSFAFPSSTSGKGLSGIKRPRSPSPWPQPLSDDPANGAPAASQGSQVLSFLFTTPPILGKFLPQKAAALGVPKGPLYGKLKNGQSISFTLDNGEEVTVASHQVVSPSSPGVAVLVVYYPTLEIAEALVASKELKASLTSDAVVLDMTCHLTSDDDLMRRVIGHINDHVRSSQKEQVQHVLLRVDQPDVDGTPYRAAAMCAIARSYACPSIFRIPSHDDATRSGFSVSGQSITIGHSMMDYRVLPRCKKGFTQMSLPPIDVQGAHHFAETSGALALAKQVMEQLQFVSADESLEGELVFTGTASSLPCKYRNVTGMALKAANGSWFLLDVGESTIGNLLRTHKDLGGPDSPLAKVKGVWISHPHADHHLGLIRLLQERKSSDPLILIAPPPLFRFLGDYQLVERGIQDCYTGYSCWDLKEENADVNNVLRQSFGFTGLRSVPVDHCAHAFAVILDGTPFGRLVYSGDCRPSCNLVEAALGADLLIHEATFEDGMEADALLKRHSTVGEALDVARRMKAKTTVLTHFSQRYPKVPPVPRCQEGPMPIIFVFDYMCLQPGTLELASLLTPAIRLLSPVHDEAEATQDKAKAIAMAEERLSIPGLFAKPGIL